MKDIETKDDIVVFVNAFYDQVRNDDTIGPIFNQKINTSHWPKHLEKMYSFWNTVLFGVAEYRGNPFSKHIPLKVDTKHFDNWILLFENAVRQNFSGPKAEEAIQRAHKMRLLFESKLKHLQSNPKHIGIM